MTPDAAASPEHRLVKSAMAATFEGAGDSIQAEDSLCGR